MFKKKITYTDYNGVERTEEFYFNLNKPEIAEMELETEGGLSNKIKEIVDTNNVGKMVKVFKNIILKSYGKKSEDGKRFIKSKELSEEFSQTEAFSEIFMECASNPDKAAEFINGVIPVELAKQVNNSNK